MAEAATEVGLDGLMPHDLRDTSAAHAIATGANIKTVQRMLGQASAPMTPDIYVGLFHDDVEQLAGRLEAPFADLVTEQARPSNVWRLPAR